jgi:S-adenosylmethionine hydrolase
MKGVILRITPNVQIIDLTHGIPPQNIRSAALTLAASFNFFPQGSIHVAVVDPGVGSERRPIVIRAAGYYFVGPDNGIFGLALKDQESTLIVHLSNEAYHLQPTSRTFHGRDIFAPVAAHLARGVPMVEFGAALKDWMRLAWPAVERAGKFVVGEVIYIDRFGNLFTNIRERDLEGVPKDRIRIFLKQIEIQGLSDSYVAGAEAKYIALMNSWGLLEVAKYNDSAASRISSEIGTEVRVELLAV